MTTDSLPGTDAVPAEWGDLVAVTGSPEDPEASLLWFQDDAGNVRIVGFNRIAGRLWEDASLIRRQ